MSRIISIPFLASSNPSLGAESINSQGSKFTLNLDKPIKIPKEAVNAYATVDAATVWWVIPNISVALNNYVFRYEINSTEYTVDIPDGLYDGDKLNTTIKRLITNKGQDSSAITLLQDTATNKFVFQLDSNTPTYTQVAVIFNGANNLREILGFTTTNSISIGATTVKSFYADTTAGLNTINSFLIRSNFIETGIRINNKIESVIAQVPIDVLPGSQIVYQPFNPQKIPCTNRIGTSISTMNFELLNDSLDLVDTNNEYWTVRMTINYVL